jgi:WD40 repeat protein
MIGIHGETTRLLLWKGHRYSVNSLVFTSEGKLVSGSNDGFVKRWAVETVEEEWARDVALGDVMGVCELFDGRLVVSGEDMSVRVLDGATGRGLAICLGHSGWVCAVVSLGDLSVGGAFASGSFDAKVWVWASDGTWVRLVDVGQVVRSLSLSPCGRFVVAGCGDGSVRLFRLPDWDLVWSAKAHDEEVISVSWSPDGRWLASGSADFTVKILCCARAGTTLRTLRGSTFAVFATLFSRDGTRVLSGSSDQTVQVWRVFGAEERRVKGLMGGLEVLEGDWGMREVCCEIVGRMKRLWEVEAE